MMGTPAVAHELCYKLTGVRIKLQHMTGQMLQLIAEISACQQQAHT